MNNFIPVKAVPMPEAMKIDPRIGRLHMTSVILPNSLHRVKFEQAGHIPDLEPILAQHAPHDGRYVCITAWMDEHGTGHVYLAWKEETIKWTSPQSRTNVWAAGSKKSLSPT